MIENPSTSPTLHSLPTGKTDYLVQPIEIRESHRIAFGRNVFEENHPLISQILQDIGGSHKNHRVLVLIDQGVAQSTPNLPEQIQAWAKSQNEVLHLASPPVVLTGGEPCKNQWQIVADLWALFDREKMDRHSFIFIIGGGAFQDMACFAASTAHRGIRHLRFPTTTLSQGDGGVGVKNAVNYFQKKNWVGTFTLPAAVINDFSFLESLPEREKRAGLIEAVKVALIRDKGFYERLESISDALSRLESWALEEAIRGSAALHVQHIGQGGDPFERGSSRPLDFGHWSAHKLEPLSEFKVNHGEAVAIGIALDLLYGTRLGLMTPELCQRILALIQKLGFEINHPLLHEKDDHGVPRIVAGLEEFREHLGGELTLTLVPELGTQIEIHEIDRSILQLALQDLNAIAPCHT